MQCFRSILFFFLLFRPSPRSTLFPYTTLFRSWLSPPWNAPTEADFRTSAAAALQVTAVMPQEDRKSTRLNSSHRTISYAVFCLKKRTKRICYSAFDGCLATGSCWCLLDRFCDL